MAAEDPTLLFEEYLAAREAGRAIDPDQLAARAGVRDAELRKRIAIFQALEELSEVGSVARDSDPTDAPDLRQLGRYRDLVLIGRGGLSRVFLAEDPLLERRVALKVLDAAQVLMRDARVWMEHEGRSLARLDHPHVLSVFDLGEADGQAYIATEYLEGPSLFAVLEHMRARARGESSGLEARHHGIDELARALEPIAARVRLVLDLARALDYIHEQGVIHRDVKPGNVILQGGCSPKWIDFGLAHLESGNPSASAVTRSLVGTPAYLAPEQVDRGATGASVHSDQFALGVVLYELLTLENPFQREHWHETVAAVSRAAPPAPSGKDSAIPADLDRICLHALERAPSARYRSVGGLADDLEAFLEHRSISLLPPTPWKVARLWARRNRRELGITAVAVAAVVLGSLGLWVASAIRVRSDFQARLAEKSAGIAGLKTNTEFARAYVDLHALAEEARKLDRAWLTSLLAGRSYEGARASVQLCSRRLSVVLADLLRVPSTSPVAGPLRDSEENRLFRDWRPVLVMDAEYCPECPDNLISRTRGQVRLPPLAPGQRVRVWGYEAVNVPGGVALVEIAYSPDPMPGDYRWSLFGSDGRRLSDIQVEVKAYDLPREIALPRITTALHASMTVVGECCVAVTPELEITVPGFRYSPLVTWGELEAVFRADEMSVLRKRASPSAPSKAPADAPAVLQFGSAVRYAASSGARLPTVTEWLAITAQRPEIAAGDGNKLEGEIVDGKLFDDRLYVDYHESNARPGRLPIGTYRATGMIGSPQGERQGYGFRLVFSDP